MFNPAVFQRAFKAAGMTVAATITTGSGETTCDVGFVRPDVLTMDGRVQSTEFEIELLDAADAPDIAEGDSVVIGGVAYTVRRAPANADPGADGTFRRVLLSKVRT